MKPINFFTGIGITLLMFTTTSLRANLIINGDLQGGDPILSGDANSDFDLACEPTANQEGFYCWGDQMQDKESLFPANVFDHTYGNTDGRMLIFDGFDYGGNNHLIWEQTGTNLNSSHSYTFTFYGRNRYTSGSNIVQIDLWLNGSYVTTFNLVASSSWQRFNYTLSGYGANTTIALVQKTQGGARDFAIDDLSLHRSDGPCLIINGDFQDGDPILSGDATSDFPLGCSLWPGYYCWCDNMNDKSGFSSAFDHTFGNSNGRMLVFDGSYSNGETAWRQDNVAMVSSLSYTFSFWGHNRFSSGSGSAVIIDLYVNMSQVQAFTINAQAGWQHFTTTLSGYGPGTDIYLVQRSGGDFRDFALDDISLCEGVEDERDPVPGEDEARKSAPGNSLNNAYEPLTLLPNPANDLVTVVMSNDFEVLDIKVRDLSGKVVLQKRITDKNKLQLDISHLQSGMYIMQATNGDQIITAKLVKK